ncbi:MAG: M48 family metallopeptidase [Proteobacteria bacterium]|nr:M48 family metallopeptidase [Pseudomonadota bacterium]
MTPRYFTTSDGEEIPLVIETRRGLSNITIRPKTNPTREIHISVPRWTPVSSALKFLEQKRAWTEKIFARAPKKVRISDGSTITLFGNKILVRHDPKGRAGVYMDDERIMTDDGNAKNASSVMIVCGSPEMLERRVRDEVKKQFLAAARAEIARVPLQFRPKRLAVRDTTTRWGSCSSTGTVSFSFRLAFAPPAVMRYVILHELAHLRHLDHSPRFWRTVAELYGPGVERAKLWLSKNGQELYRYF